MQFKAQYVVRKTQYASIGVEEGGTRMQPHTRSMP